MRDRTHDDKNLAIASDKPKLDVIHAEIEKALTDANVYYQRNQNAASWWHSQWPDQVFDGRKHKLSGADDPFPWDGASDTRVQMIGRLVKQHVMVDRFAFMKGKIQATAHRPFSAAGADAAVATRLLRWMVYSHMRAEIARECPLASAWRCGYGASYLSVEWETARRTDYIAISLPTLEEFIQASGGDPSMISLMESLLDPKQEDALVQLLQQLSPLVTKGKARKILGDLRTTGSSEVPVPYVFKSKPKWTAQRAVIDVLHPFDVSDIQASPWIATRERIDEVTLRDRIETEDYDPDFVDELLKHKGETDNATWADRTASERAAAMGGLVARPDSSGLVELYHVIYKAMDPAKGSAPCLYRTIMSPVVKKSRNGDMLYASHGDFPYDHGEYPLIPRRFELDDRPILSSRGIPEIAYTWEQEIKAQRDARTDRTAIVNAPPMVVPSSRVDAIRGTYGPRAILGVSRPNELSWMPLPPTDGSPIAIEQQVLADVREHFPLFGVDLDPELKTIYRQTYADETNGEYTLAFEQTLKLMQQFEPDDAVKQVVGELQRPFRISKEQISGAWQIRIGFDAGMLDEDYAMSRLDMLGKMMGFNQTGLGDMNEIFIKAVSIVDPDMAEDLQHQNPQAATEKEVNDAENNVNQALNGITPRPPMIGNHQLRLQTIMQTIQQPGVQQRLMSAPDSQEILKKLMEFHQNQIQQHQKNPQIGRTLATKPFDSSAALPTSSPLAAA